MEWREHERRPARLAEDLQAAGQDPGRRPQRRGGAPGALPARPAVLRGGAAGPGGAGPGGPVRRGAGGAAGGVAADGRVPGAPADAVPLWVRKTAYERLLNLHRAHWASARRSVRREVRLPERSSLAL